MNVGSALKNTSALSTNWSHITSTRAGGTSTFYINKGQADVKTLNSSKEVTATMSSTPATGTAISVASSSASDTTYTVSLTGDTRVARTLRIYYGSTAGSTSNNSTTSVSQGSSVTTGISINIESFAGGDVHFKGQHINADKDGGFLQSGARTVPSFVSWGSPHADFTWTVPAGTTGVSAYSQDGSNVTIALSGGSGGTTISRGGSGGILIAVSTSGDPGTSGTSNSGTGFSSGHTLGSFNSGTLHMRFKYTMGGFGGTFSNEWSFTNSSVTNDDLDVTATSFF
jgi:hypothetical protein